MRAPRALLRWVGLGLGLGKKVRFLCLLLRSDPCRSQAASFALFLIRGASLGDGLVDRLVRNSKIILFALKPVLESPQDRRWHISERLVVTTGKRREGGRGRRFRLDGQLAHGADELSLGFKDGDRHGRGNWRGRGGYNDIVWRGCGHKARAGAYFSEGSGVACGHHVQQETGVCVDAPKSAGI